MKTIITKATRIYLLITMIFSLNLAFCQSNHPGSDDDVAISTTRDFYYKTQGMLSNIFANNGVLSSPTGSGNSCGVGKKDISIMLMNSLLWSQYDTFKVQVSLFSAELASNINVFSTTSTNYEPYLEFPMVNIPFCGNLSSCGYMANVYHFQQGDSLSLGFIDQSSNKFIACPYTTVYRNNSNPLRNDLVYHQYLGQSYVQNIGSDIVTPIYSSFHMAGFPVFFLIPEGTNNLTFVVDIYAATKNGTNPISNWTLIKDNVVSVSTALTSSVGHKNCAASLFMQTPRCTPPPFSSIVPMCFSGLRQDQSVPNIPIDFEIGPNPVSNRLLIHMNLHKEGPLEIEVFNIHGSLIKKAVNTGKIGKNEITMDLANLSRGTYIIKATNNWNWKTKIFIKE